MLTDYTMSQIVFVKDGSLYCVSKENVVPLSGEWKNDKYVRGYEKTAQRIWTLLHVLHALLNHRLVVFGGVTKTITDFGALWFVLFLLH